MRCSAFTFFWLFDTGNLALAALATVLAHASTSFAWAVVPPLLTRAFPALVRYTGISMAYQFGAIVGGGFAPLIATSLLAATGTPISVAVYVAVASAVMLVCALLLARTRTHQDTALRLIRAGPRPHEQGFRAHQQRLCATRSRMRSAG